jgi:hypothetical protein
MVIPGGNLWTPDDQQLALFVGEILQHIDVGRRHAAQPGEMDLLS